MTRLGMAPSMTAVVMLMALASFGCSGSAGVHRANADYPRWPAVEKFSSEELTPIAMTADFGDWKKFQTLVIAADYRAAVEEFTATPVPTKWATPERTAAKDKAAADMKALIEAAEAKKPPKELESLWKAVCQSLGELTKAAR
jgi:hypothetical protein